MLVGTIRDRLSRERPGERSQTCPSRGRRAVRACGPQTKNLAYLKGVRLPRGRAMDVCRLYLLREPLADEDGCRLRYRGDRTRCYDKLSRHGSVGNTASGTPLPYHRPDPELQEFPEAGPTRKSVVRFNELMGSATRDGAVEGLPVDQVSSCFGCTNGRIEDLRAAAEGACAASDKQWCRRSYGDDRLGGAWSPFKGWKPK